MNEFGRRKSQTLKRVPIFCENNPQVLDYADDTEHVQPSKVDYANE